jgi:DNA repair protein RadA/Sms
MARVRTSYRCGGCGAGTPRWAGRCHACGDWNSLVEEVDARPAAPRLESADQPSPIADVDAGEWRARPTGVPELDRVLGGGLVPGSVTLLGGEPGIGKSTLLLQALSSLAADGARVLLVCGEESKQQVRLRADRLGVLSDGLWLVAETEVPSVIAHVAELAPDCLAVDSIQTLADPDLESAPGSVGQVRGCGHRLVRLAKERAMATVVVGHVTKDGSLAGPKVLEHEVDTVLSFEGERHHALRLLRATKHRFGHTQGLGLFEMTGTGLAGVDDPSALFLADRRAGVAGSIVAPVMDGNRPLVVELQALVAPLPEKSPLNPRRSVQGLDPARLALLLAVLDCRAGLALGGADVYVSVVGGVRVTEPAADLALALALASAHTGRPLPQELVACGEVGLGGELRQVSQTGRRLAEAARLGFRGAMVPASGPERVEGLNLVRVRTLHEAVERLGLGPTST